MFLPALSSLCRTAVLLIALPIILFAQKPPYDVFSGCGPALLPNAVKHFEPIAPVVFGFL